MSYLDLSESSLTDAERLAEAAKLGQMLIDEAWGSMSPQERNIANYAVDDPRYVSVKQLFWLRDLRDKYL